MKLKVIDIHGNEKNEIELSDEIFNIKPNKTVVYEVIKNELANRRQGTASTKTKGEVRGSGAKPYRQKGTGRARVGTRRSPVWKGGGIVFGPKPRDYSYSLPKKMKRLAYKSILSLKNIEGNLKIIENFKIENGKTKEIVKIFKPLSNNETKFSLILDDNEEALLIKKAGRNVPWIRCLSFNRMNAHSLYYSKNIFLTEDAVLKINTFFENKKESGKKDER
ncbi:MAG: 50S ribosomal protein L4 [Spirochaetes bacterium]|nr:50S ribosomal protein L4 [Spirochaetota bacterium]